MCDDMLLTLKHVEVPSKMQLIKHVMQNIWILRCGLVREQSKMINDELLLP